MKKLFLLLLLLPLTANAQTSTPSKVSLPVPFYWEIPDGVWVRPWNGACEESAISAAEGYYLGRPKQIVSKADEKRQMLPLFPIEDKLFGYDSDTDAAENLKLINDYTSFDAILKTNPTLDEIKAELAAGHPVISMHYGYALKNPRHRFRAGASSYHVMTITGYDDSTGEFLVNDPELPDGIDFRYKYDIILTTLHDFNHTTKHADGPAVVLFTRPKQIVKAVGGSRIYLIRDNKKYYIASPAVFKNHRWSWSLVKTVDKGTLDGMQNGSAIAS